MARNSRRRNSLSNRRLPTRLASSQGSVIGRLPTRLASSQGSVIDRINSLNAILKPGVVYSDYDLVKTVRAQPTPLKRHLAPSQKSRFPKTYSPRTFTGQVRDVKNQVRNLNPVTRLKTCVGRAVRAEVMHAIGEAGKSGQKTPRWTPKSKVKC